VKLETLLPLGKLDPGLRQPETPLRISEFGRGARLAEELGYDTVLVEETKEDPYQLLALGASSTSTVGLGTSVAMAFPRSPTITAMSAWSLQKLSAGRFTLGLGSQVRGHVRRRFGLAWHPPAPWMRDYVRAVRAVWSAWQERTPLDFHSEHYDLTLMVPLFDPGPIAHPNIPIHIAGIGPAMCRVAGEVADGLRLHPVCTPAFIDERIAPAMAAGARRAGRAPSDIELCMKPLVGTAVSPEELEPIAESVRSRVAFYVSTPAYRRVFEFHGWGELADRAAALSRAGRWEELSRLIPDEVLHTVATLATHDTIADRLIERYGNRVDRIEFSIPVNAPGAADRLREILASLRAATRTR
jgi:probable F420-dependent oxidoreductase